MTGSKTPDKPTDEMCPSCGLYFSRRGIIPHSRNCDRDDPLLPLDRHDDVDFFDGRASSDGSALEAFTPTPSDGGSPGGDSPDPSDDDGDPSESSVRSDGSGLGLGGPPTPSQGVDENDQDDADDGGPCCDDPVLRALDAGTRLSLEDETIVEAADGDQLCDACGALVEDDGRVRR